MMPSAINNSVLIKYSVLIVGGVILLFTLSRLVEDYKIKLPAYGVLLREYQALPIPEGDVPASKTRDIRKIGYEVVSADWVSSHSTPELSGFFKHALEKEGYHFAGAEDISVDWAVLSFEDNQFNVTIELHQSGGGARYYLGLSTKKSRGD